MSRKTFWLLLTGMIVVALTLSSCQGTTEQPGQTTVVPGTTTPGGSTTPSTTGGQTITTPQPTQVKNAFGKMVDKPAYGGTLTILWGTTSTQVWDPIVSTTAFASSVLIYETLGQGDWGKGPQGTNEFGFDTTYVPDPYLTGDLGESWERPDNKSVILHVRQGVRWQNKAPMHGREFTADDVVYSFTRGTQDPRNTYYSGPTVPADQKWKIEALDKYTVKFTAPDPDARMIHSVTEWQYMQPKEAIQQYGNLDNWKNAVGTGPFMVKDCVPDSSALLIRNPDYWMPDPFFPENKLPYVDKLECLVITDLSTRISAMRTHKIDIYSYFPWDKVASMQQTNPEIKVRKMPADLGMELFMRTDKAPFNDVRVRQALQYAVDEPAIANEYYKGDALILGWPIQPFFKDEYTPLEQLPQNLREMYEFKPDKAKELLAAAGYPTGIKCEVAVSATATTYIETLSIVKDQWAKANITLEIKPTEASTFVSILYGKTYPSLIYTYWGNNGIDDVFGWAHDGWVGKGGAKSVYAFSAVNDPIATEAYVKLMTMTDFAAMEQFRKEENLREIELAWEVSLPIPSVYMLWQPWVKGYAGEAGIGPDQPEFGGVTRHVWVDGSLKTQITGTKE